MKKITVPFLFFATTILPVWSVIFTPGDLAVFQATASAFNTTASILELNPTTANQSSPVQTITIPDGSSSSNGLRFNGSATSTGYLSRTADRTLLAFSGANSTNTSNNVNTLNPRGVGTVDGAGNYNLATTYTGGSGNQTRSATSLNNTGWYIGDQGGLYTNSAGTASPTGNLRSIKTFGGTVYGFQQSATSPLVSTVSAPSGGSLTGLSGVGNSASGQDFYLISSGSNGITFDVLYVLTSTSATAGSILKFSLVNGNWTSNGTYTTSFGGFGLAAAQSGTGASLFATTGTGATLANSLIALTDTAGYNAAITITTASNTTLYTAPTGTILKGVDFAPVPEPTVLALAIVGLGFLVLMARRRVLA